MLLWLVRDDTSVNLAVVVGMINSIVSVLLLLLFAHTVSTRVTVVQKAARISEALDRQVSTAI